MIFNKEMLFSKNKMIFTKYKNLFEVNRDGIKKIYNVEESSLSVTSTPNRSEKPIAGDRKRRLPQRHSLFFKQTLSVIYYDSLLERYKITLTYLDIHRRLQSSNLDLR